MPVRLRITLLFAVTVLTILLVVCGTVYYVSYTSRRNSIQTRLTNRAYYAARLLSQSEVFNSELMQKIDTSTAGAPRDKEIQVYDKADKKIYSHSDIPNDTITVDNDLLHQIREKGVDYFVRGKREAVGIYYELGDLVIVSATNDEIGKKNLVQLKIILWLSLLGGVVISLGGGYFFSIRLMRPIRQIADEVNEISAKNLTKRIRTGYAKDEWDYLSQTLNSLLNRLQESFEVQQRFISNASHELSTPLTSISNQLEVSLQKERSAEEYRKFMHSMLQDVKRMNKLTQTLLELAKASGSPGGLEIEAVRIDEVLLRLPSEITKIFTNGSVLVQFDTMPVEENQLLVLGNEELLFLAVKNIVSNACKYSANHHAEVTLHVLPKEIIIEVSDYGQGIASEDIKHIFLPFYRSANSSLQSGFGLGLSLADHIVKLHKGKILVKSEISKGTVFQIFLPPAFEIESPAD